MILLHRYFGPMDGFSLIVGPVIKLSERSSHASVTSYSQASDQSNGRQINSLQFSGHCSHSAVDSYSKINCQCTRKRKKSYTVWSLELSVMVKTRTTSPTQDVKNINSSFEQGKRYLRVPIEFSLCLRNVVRRLIAVSSCYQ